jgi:hypothetical protein
VLDGRTKWKCGVCEKSQPTGYVTTPAQKKAMVSAKIKFNAAHTVGPTLSDDQRFSLFLKQNPQWDFKALDANTPAKPSGSSQESGLRDILNNQELVGLPFMLA